MKIEEPAREGFLYQIWLNRASHFTCLNSVRGEKIQILEKGIRNYDSGPDFLNALLVIDGKMVRGDIEVDPVANDWYVHGHHRNPHYNNVVLHIITMDCPADAFTTRQDGTCIPIVNLDDFLEKPAEQLEKEKVPQETIILTQCALRSADPPMVRQVLERAGDARLVNKTARLTEKRYSSSWNQIFYQAVLEALGYSKNQIPFRNLSCNLPVEMLWNYLWKDSPSTALMKCEAFLLGAAGLLPSQSAAPWESNDEETIRYVREREKIWRQYPLCQKVTVLKPEMWQFFRLRPNNFPTRRLAAAAVLVLRFMNYGFVETLTKIVLNCEETKQTIEEIEKLLLVESFGFWNTHFYFGNSGPEASIDGKYSLLLGSERCRDIIVNGFIPGLLAFAEETGDGRLQNILKELYNRFPRLEENEITRVMRKQLHLISGRKAQFKISVRHQQGLIHLKKLLCLSTACDRCLTLDSFF